VLVALAEAFADVETDATIRFVFFGAEEVVGSSPDDHHFGSRHYVQRLSDSEKARIAGMFSVDMVGVGPDFHVRTMQKGPMSLADATLQHAERYDYPLTYLKDAGSYGWSDHEPFENAGIPATWIGWREDPYYHTAKDTYPHVDAKKVRSTGELLAGFLIAQDEEDLKGLRD
jgi:Zn-dependent M28 family amino/carboxypeptidase